MTPRASAAISSELLAALREDIALRRIDSGMQRLAGAGAIVERFDPADPNAAAFVGYMAQWVDIGFGEPELIKTLLAFYPRSARAGLKVRDYIHLRMAEGLAAMTDEEPDQAIRHFEFALTLDAEVEDKELLAIAEFWVGRCLRKKGEYDAALQHTIRGRDLALELGYPRMAAVMRALEGWLSFQKGRAKDALKTLSEAAAILSGTDDYITLGNIHSSYGRIALRESRHENAVEHFLRAIEEYRKRSPNHRNLARSLANLAYAERLIALQLGKRIDAEAKRRRTAGAKPAFSTQATRERLQKIRTDALVHLDQAAGIYALHPHHHGEGTLRVNRGLLFLDAGEWDGAAEEAARAFELGEQKHDYILMARGRLLQCVVENAKLDDEVEERANPSHHAEAAQQFAAEAVEFAMHTENRRLLARAWVWRGITLANDYFQNVQAAAEWYDRAAAALKSEPHDQLWDELQVLKARLLRTGGVDSALRMWSQGSVGNKTYRQIEEEFADIIIPKVWEREGRKISRVAERLSISPKKVRRILRRAGLLEGSAERS